MTAEALLTTLDGWRVRGWLRRLDVAFARFVVALAAEQMAKDTAGGPVVPVPATLVLAAALLVRLEGRGHSCLPLHWLVDSPEALAALAWEPATLLALQTAWREAGGSTAGWAASGVIEQRPSTQGERPIRQSHADGLRQPDPSGERAPGSAPLTPVVATPLVLDDGRLYLRRYWQYEQQVAAAVAARTVDAVGLTPSESALARLWLDRLFPSPVLNDALTVPDGQRTACEVALRARFTIITGGPGTGKTYTAARLWVVLQALQAPGGRPLKVALAAPTGKAAARLHQSMLATLLQLDTEFAAVLPATARATVLPMAQTLHKLLGARADTRALRHTAANLLDVDVVFVDEASMVHLEMMAALLAAVPAHARVILLGDKDQLESVEAGAVLADLCQAPAGSALQAQTVTLQRSQRYSGQVAALAAAVNAGDITTTRAVFQATPDGAVSWRTAMKPHSIAQLALEGRAGAPVSYRRYVTLLAQRPATADLLLREAATGLNSFEAWACKVLQAFESFRVLCAVREGLWGVAGVNSVIERALFDAQLLQGNGEWYEGRPVMVTRNDRALGVANGDVGLVLRSPVVGEALRVYFSAGDGLRSVATTRLQSVETAFALTVHKSQGSEFEHVVVVLGVEGGPAVVGHGLSRELVYTAVTRARQQVTLVAGSEAVLAAALARRTQRVSGLGNALR